MLLVQVASSNPGKIAEFRLGVQQWQKQAGQSFPLAVEPVPGFAALPSCEEDAGSFAGNAAKKALHYSRLLSGLVLADDSGLEVDALEGAPGVSSRRFAGPGATDADNNAKLLRQMLGIPAAKRAARFVCELALAREGGLLTQFRGMAEGILLELPRGESGFGYDPLFLDPELHKTFAELSREEKLQRSHRGRALWALLEWLAAQSSSNLPLL
ncbi:MAG: non-canonical purine NTP pyrophosphatase [Acidobacteria bacterium]|nr:non-canonical purine NTP pyrophosphatase [Acidobacteriota bacterium]